MFYNARPGTFEKAKILRDNMTVAEHQLWEHLKGKKMPGFRFRPQHPINIFIADFYCHPLKLVIEIDGGIHMSKEQKEYDANRTAELNNWGLKVIRFSNEEIEHGISSVISQITKICLDRRYEVGSPL